jgi:hypothetical protein
MDLSEALQRGFQGQVRKPTSPAELLRAVLGAIETFVVAEQTDPLADNLHAFAS